MCRGGGRYLVRYVQLGEHVPQVHVHGVRCSTGSTWGLAVIAWFGRRMVDALLPLVAISN